MFGFIKKVMGKFYSYFGRESASYILCLRDHSLDHISLCDDFIFSSDDSEIAKFVGFLRIENKSYKEWVENGSLLCVAKLESRNGLPRGWVHFAGVRNVSSFACSIGRNAAWLGPDYTPIEYRGKKLHVSIIEQRVLEAFKNECIDSLFTAINVHNVASLKNYLRCGFQIVGLLRSRRFIFFTFRRKAIYSDIVFHGLKIE